MTVLSALYNCVQYGDLLSKSRGDGCTTQVSFAVTKPSDQGDVKQSIELGLWFHVHDGRVKARWQVAAAAAESHRRKRETNSKWH